jgi:hypothetical protein
MARNTSLWSDVVWLLPPELACLEKEDGARTDAKMMQAIVLLHG